MSWPFLDEFGPKMNFGPISGQFLANFLASLTILSKNRDVHRRCPRGTKQGSVAAIHTNFDKIDEMFTKCFREKGLQSFFRPVPDDFI